MDETLPYQRTQASGEMTIKTKKQQKMTVEMRILRQQRGVNHRNLKRELTIREIMKEAGVR